MIDFSEILSRFYKGKQFSAERRPEDTDEQAYDRIIWHEAEEKPTFAELAALQPSLDILNQQLFAASEAFDTGFIHQDIHLIYSDDAVAKMTSLLVYYNNKVDLGRLNPLDPIRILDSKAVAHTITLEKFRHLIDAFGTQYFQLAAILRGGS